MRIACKGSINYEQHQLVLEIFGLCGTIKLEIEWISRTMNTIADESSKIYDYDDWRVSAKKYVFKKKKSWVYINCNVHVLADSKKN